MTDTYDPTTGVILDYSAMTPLPIIRYDSDTNAIVFNNPIVPASGFAAQDVQHNLEFASPVIFDTTIAIGDQTSFIPMPLPTHPLDLNIPAVQSTGTIQTTDLMVAKNGNTYFYSDELGVRVFGDITVDGNITNANLTNMINNIQLTPGPAGPTGETGPKNKRPALRNRLVM